MPKLETILENDIPIKRYTYLKNLRILETEEQKILMKPKKKYDLETVYQYLDDHHVTDYLKPLAIRNDTVLFPFISDSLLTGDEKAKKMVYHLSLWQNKTTTNQRIDIDKVKETYETYQQRIQYLNAYYHDLQDMIETKVYMAPSEYLFIRNSSFIYEALNYAHQLLQQWYQKMQQKKTQRKVYCHGKCELSHFLVADQGYFISLEKAHLGNVYEDFAHFFHQNFKDVDMISTFRFYQQKYPFTEEETLEFYVQILLPDMIEIYPSSLATCQKLVHFFERMKVTREFLLEQQEYKQKHQQS